MAPVQAMSEYHEKLASEYDKLSSQADILEAMGKNDRDNNSGTYARYKAYSDALRQEADNLYRFGLNSESRQRLSDLRRRYNTEIVPIQNAWNKRDEEQKIQTNARMQHPELRFTRDAMNTSLDEYIKNPQGGFGVVNLNNIAAQMSDAAKNLAKQYRSGRTENIDGYTKNFITENGLDPKLIADWQNDQTVSPTLTNMMKQVLQANGLNSEEFVNSPNGASIMNEAIGAAQRGAWSAVGDSKSQVIEDFEKRLTARTQAAVQEAMAKAYATGKLGGEGSEMPNIPSVAVGLTSSDEYSSKNLDVLNTLKIGHDALNSKYFGKVLGQVNPMSIYKEYQREGGNKEARQKVLNKYKKYGVSDILSEDQYNALSSAGYSEKNNIKSTRHSDILNDFNKTVEQHSRYSTNMSDYEAFNDRVLPNLRTRGMYNNSIGTVWAIKDNGNIGESEDIDDLKLYSSENTKGNKVTDVQYDPRFKGKIVLQLSDGSLHVADPGIYDSNLSNMIQYAERQGAPAMAITMAITRHLNERNKVKGKTDSKIE